jgi:AI-2 transport protein TqsA
VKTQPTNTNLRNEQIWLAVCSLMILAAVALATGLVYTRGVMIPFVLAVFIVTVVSPLVDFLVARWKFPRSIAISVAMLAVLAVLAVLGLMLVVAIQTMLKTADDYSGSFMVLAKRLLTQLDAWEIGVDWSRILADMQGKIPGAVAQTVGTATALLSNGFLIMIFAAFLLVGRTSSNPSTGIYAEIESTIRRYIATKLAISTVTGLLVWAILAMFGLRLAFLFGMLAFSLNFIPSIGSVIATLLPIPVAVVQFQDPWLILAVVALPGAVQMSIGNVIEPKLMGDGVKLHPVTILLSLAFWGLLWGPIGMILAVPITATIRIVIVRFQTTKPIGDLLAGRLPESAEPVQ